MLLKSRFFFHKSPARAISANAHKLPLRPTDFFSVNLLISQICVVQVNSARGEKMKNDFDFDVNVFSSHSLPA